jgi:hypothetical protein
MVEGTTYTTTRRPGDRNPCHVTVRSTNSLPGGLSGVWPQVKTNDYGAQNHWSAYEGCQAGGEIFCASFAVVPPLRGAQRQRSGGARASGGIPSRPRRPASAGSGSLCPLQSRSFLLRGGGVLLRVRHARLFDRGRRRKECRGLSSRTWSYPGSCVMAQRPLCHSRVTAATGASAPSNARGPAGFPSSSHGQDAPGRQGSHSQGLGSGRSQSEAESAGGRWGKPGGAGWNSWNRAGRR